MNLVDVQNLECITIYYITDGYRGINGVDNFCPTDRPKVHRTNTEGVNVGVQMERIFPTDHPSILIRIQFGAKFWISKGFIRYGNGFRYFLSDTKTD